MGTRHMQTVINKKGETKLAQYGQWDGYPSGQGVEILSFLKKASLSLYLENVNKLPIVTDAEIDEVNKSTNWKEEYPYLSRDCGSDIHQLILDGDVKFVQHTTDADGWCEGFYTIDFKNNTFTSEFHGSSATYQLDDLPTHDQYLKDMSDSDEEE